METRAFSVENDAKRQAILHVSWKIDEKGKMANGIGVWGFAAALWAMFRCHDSKS